MSSQYLCIECKTPMMADDGQLHTHGDCVEYLKAALSSARKELALPVAPIPMFLTCPICKTQHVDEDEWATRPHKTHLCADCGWEWKVANVPTVGVRRCDLSGAVALLDTACERALDEGELLRMEQLRMTLGESK